MAIFFSFYYSLIVTDCRKKSVFVVPCGIHILSIFLNKTSITWLLAIRVELNAVTLPVVPLSLVFLSSTSSKAAVITSSDGKERRNCDSQGHKVSRPLIRYVPHSGFMCLFPTRHATISWISRAHSACFVGECPYNSACPEGSSRDKWPCWQPRMSTWSE